jgi:heme exporter protein C
MSEHVAAAASAPDRLAGEMDRFVRHNLLLLVAAGILLVAALGMVFLYAPQERVMGEVQRIFYFHVASAWLAMLAFLVVFIGSVLYLWKGDRRYDRWAATSAEIGVLFTTIVLLTGPLWARPVWNTWWTWDPRLTSSLILWIMYVAYLVLRGALPESRKKYQFSAVYGLVAFLDVPIVFFSIRWWRSMHPVVITGKGMNLEPEMVQTLVVSCIAFTLLYFLLLRFRLMVERLGDELQALQRSLLEME